MSREGPTPLWSLLAALLSGMLVSCGGGGGSSPTPDRYPLAQAQEVDPGGLARAYSALATNPYVRFLLVERNGVLVMEEYFNGSGEVDSVDVRSVTKTVTSVLVGIAIDRGFIRDIDQTVGDFLGPALHGLAPDKARISIRNLLTMTSGLPWRELNSDLQDYSDWVNSPDPLLWILSKPLDHPPGEFWHYNTGASHILSAVLTEATGTTERALAQESLFGPLESEVGEWPTDPRGYNYGGHGISLTGRAMVKLGRLFLDGGTYQGRQVVSESWVRESTTQRYSTNNAVPWGSGYGYLWWIGRDDVTSLGFYFANGYGGQFIVDVPSRNTTIVAATAWSGVPNPDQNWYLVMHTIVQAILPSLR
jgi:CubicO group peptidase (beta-lactamase class C family)